MQLSKYIAELLQQHDCVVVPNFGGFIANYKAAAINEGSSRMNPPSKNVLFNPNLVNNDGLLGNQIAMDKSISYPNALDFINNAVIDWQIELEKGKRVEIGEIGFLFKRNNQIVFEQSREMNLLLQAYGLHSVSFVRFEHEKEDATFDDSKEGLTVEKETVVIELNTTEKVEEVKPVHAEEDNVIPINQPRKKSRLRYLAVAAAIPILFYSYWIPMETDFMDTGKIQSADFNPINTTPNRIYQMRQREFESSVLPKVSSWEELTADLSDHVAVYNYQFDKDLYIPIRLDKAIAETTKTDVIEKRVDEKEIVEVVDGPLIYHLIGGCFSIKENAEQFVKDYTKKGFDANILDFNKGLYRVTLGDFAQKEKAQESLDSFTRKGNSGWILKK